LIAKPSAALVLGTVVSMLYIILFYFSAVPVSTWLGNFILKDMYSLPIRFGAGLTIITLCLYSFELLSKIQGIGLIFSIILFISKLVIIATGTGALLHAWWEVLKIIRRQETLNND
ncbi:MAG: hypothetical protein K0R31_1685, partial [Clostridiales bacterium]|nr:hypothetical protein [Clostridiales bacterium]